MSKQDLTKSRWGIGLNYFSILIILFTMEYVNRFESIFSPGLTGAFFLVAILYWMISTYRTYWKTKWWKYVHQKSDKFDEREIKSIGEAMRLSYSIFVFVIALILFIYSTAEWSINGLFAAFVIYFAHILPASILKWQGNEI